MFLDNFTFQNEEDTAAKIEFHQDALVKNDKQDWPFFLFVGSLDGPESTDVVFAEARYKCDSLSGAFDLALRIFIAFELPYPKASQQSWVLMENLWFRCDLKKCKINEPTSTTLSHFDRKLKPLAVV